MIQYRLKRYNTNISNMSLNLDKCFDLSFCSKWGFGLYINPDTLKRRCKNKSRSTNWMRSRNSHCKCNLLLIINSNGYKSTISHSLSSSTIRCNKIGHSTIKCRNYYQFTNWSGISECNDLTIHKI